MTTKTFPIDPFKHGVCVFFGTDDEFRLHVAKDDALDIGVADDCAAAMENSKMATLRLDSGDAIVFGRSVPADVQGRATLVHELFHSVSCILQNIGVIHTDETEEVYAYTLENLTERVFTWLSSEFP